jgi:hypothetical protein
MARSGSYVIFGMLPVKEEPVVGGGVKVLKLNWETLAFERGYEYGSRMTYDTGGDVEHVTKDQFIEHVEAIRAENYSKNDELGALYKTMNAIENAAKEQNRQLTGGEKAKLTALRHKTYAMFAEKYPEPGGPPES